MNTLPDDILDVIYYSFLGYKQMYSLVIHQVMGGLVVTCGVCNNTLPIMTREEQFRIVMSELLSTKMICDKCQQS